MRYSRMLIPTVKEVPADAEVTSHKLMLRAGLMRKVASGTYTYLPLGWRCLLKVIAIVREEMNRSGAQEILMPAVQPIELWQKTGTRRRLWRNPGDIHRPPRPWKRPRPNRRGGRYKHCSERNKLI